MRMSLMCLWSDGSRPGLIGILDFCEELRSTIETELQLFFLVVLGTELLVIVNLHPDVPCAVCPFRVHPETRVFSPLHALTRCI